MESYLLVEFFHVRVGRFGYDPQGFLEVTDGAFVVASDVQVKVIITQVFFRVYLFEQVEDGRDVAEHPGVVTGVAVNVERLRRKLQLPFTLSFL